MDKLHEECGVFGIFGHPEAANMTYLGLYALQHRGQESAGVAASDGREVRVSRAMGYVADTFNNDVLSQLPGTSAIGHVSPGSLEHVPSRCHGPKAETPRSGMTSPLPAACT